MSSRAILGINYPGISYSRRLDPLNQDILLQNSFFLLPYTEDWISSSFEGIGNFRAKSWAPGNRCSYRQGTNRLGHIIGIAKNSTGGTLSACTVRAFIAATDILYLSVAAGTDGSFDIAVPDYTTEYYLVAFSSADATLAGTTVKTISGV